MFVPVDSLQLDPENPRLPEELLHSDQPTLFEYLASYGVLDELIGSMLDNGFFEHEPLIVLRADETGKRTVVEGNRRLAALMAIFGRSETGGVAPLFEVPPDRQAELAEVPVYEVDNREEVRAFLGFRHISGLKPWPSEAKARYLALQVDQVSASGEANPFVEVGRQIGSNALGVRNSYLAFVILRHAREECGIDIRHVLTERFGVWQRCMTSPDIRSHMGLADPKTYAAVTHQVQHLDCERLSEIIGDLTPRAGERAV